MSADIRIKRVYEPADRSDGHRVLVDRVWPSISRERARLDEWVRELAPSDELRKWFGHEPARFKQFRNRYRNELAKRPDDVEQLRARAAEGSLTLLYAARDEHHNNAVVLAELLRGD